MPQRELLQHPGLQTPEQTDSPSQQRTDSEHWAPRALRLASNPHLAMVKLAIATSKTGWGKKKTRQNSTPCLSGSQLRWCPHWKPPLLGRAAPPRASRRQVCPVPLPSAGRIRSIPPPCPSALTPPLGFHWSLPPGPGVTLPGVLPSNTAVQFYLRNVNCTPVPLRAPHLQRDRAGLGAWCTQGLPPGAQRIGVSAPVINVT